MTRIIPTIALCLLCCLAAAQTITVGTLNVPGGLTVVASTNVPPEESEYHTLPDSLYLTNKPAFFGTMNWPPFDPTAAASVNATNIPAGLRFATGDL